MQLSRCSPSRVAHRGSPSFMLQGQPRLLQDLASCKAEQLSESGICVSACTMCLLRAGRAVRHEMEHNLCVVDNSRGCLLEPFVRTSTSMDNDPRKKPPG